MKFGTGVAVLAVAAIGLSAAPAQASPVDDVVASGVEQGVAYRTVLSDPAGTITMTLDGGAFEFAENATKVVLKSAAGAIVAVVPLAFAVETRKLWVAGEISHEGRRLALTPTVGAAEIGELRPVPSMTHLTAELEKNVVGLVAGGLIGGILGAVLGLGFFSIITGPIGLIVGAIAGGYIMGGQSFTEAVAAVLEGRP